MGTKGINKVIIIGNVGADVVSRYTTAGVCTVNISVATTDFWKDKTTGEMQEKTEWHRVVLYDNLALVAANFLKKGSKVYIEGSLHTRKYTDRSNKERYVTEIIGTVMQSLTPRDMERSGNEATQGEGILKVAVKPTNLDIDNSKPIGAIRDNVVPLREDDDLPF